MDGGPDILDEPNGCSDIRRVRKATEEEQMLARQIAGRIRDDRAIQRGENRYLVERYDVFHVRDFRGADERHMIDSLQDGRFASLGLPGEFCLGSVPAQPRPAAFPQRIEIRRMKDDPRIRRRLTRGNEKGFGDIEADEVEGPELPARRADIIVRLGVTAVPCNHLDAQGLQIFKAGRHRSHVHRNENNFVSDLAQIRDHPERRTITGRDICAWQTAVRHQDTTSTTRIDHIHALHACRTHRRNRRMRPQWIALLGRPAKLFRLPWRQRAREFG